MPRLLYIASLALLFVGCTQKIKTVPTVQVSGNVTIGGKPIEGVEVRFFTDTFESFGKTDAQGNYQLVAGAEVGQNKVVFNKTVGGSSAIKLDPDKGVDEGQIAAIQLAQESAGGKGIAVQRELIPEDYSKREKTPIMFNVPEEGTTKADFKVPGK